MKRFLPLLFACFLLASNANAQFVCHSDYKENFYTPNTLVITFTADNTKGNAIKAAKKKKCKIVRNLKEDNKTTIKIPETWDLEEARAFFKKIKGVVEVRREELDPNAQTQ
ncbi:hypothetical protein [Prevotella ihumii]|uniref:hypothetical protein n=1 Tax=Prevotella ihumii TaxID=1917878 RepID=UPI000A04E9F7|nr:hypothetical protein [Prevotella ihumii]